MMEKGRKLRLKSKLDQNWKEILRLKSKLLTSLIDLFKDLIKEKISLKVYWTKIERIN